MIRILLAAALSALAMPAAAQTVSGCSSVAANRVATSTDRAKLRADIDCARRAADSIAAPRVARIVELDKAPAAPVKPAPVPTPAPKPTPIAGPGDATEPLPNGSSPTLIPAKIASNFDRAPLIGKTGVIPPNGAPDIVGAFRFICGPGQVSYDDPIVFPGQPGKSHLHQWYGNLSADGNSTYASLRATGDSTCTNQLNRSAYWMPAMLDGRGNVVRPDYVSIYYKRLPANSPQCRIQGQACVDLPRGLRFVFGYDMVTDTAPTGALYFNCANDPGTWSTGHHPDIAAIAPKCGPGPGGEKRRLGAIIAAPDCWDGKRLDSPNHRDHMAYTTYGIDGQPHCPATHPMIVPTFTLGAWYDVGDIAAGQPGSVATWELSSDSMTMAGKSHKMTPGSTFHADWWGAWDDDVMATWTANCIDKLLNCSGGELGDGTVLKPQFPLTYRAEPRLVPIPVRP